MSVMKHLSWRAPGSWPLQRWMDRQSRVVRFLVGFILFIAVSFVMAALVPWFRPFHLFATLGGATGFGIATILMTPRR